MHQNANQGTSNQSFSQLISLIDFQLKCKTIAIFKHFKIYLLSLNCSDIDLILIAV